MLEDQDAPQTEEDVDGIPDQEGTDDSTQESEVADTEQAAEPSEETDSQSDDVTDQQETEEDVSGSEAQPAAPEPAPEAPEPVPAAATLHPALANIKKQIDDYVKVMGNRTVSEKVGVEAQNNLFYMLRQTLMLPDAQFRQGFKMVLDAFTTHRNGVFGPRQVFRYMDKMKVTPEYLKGMQALIQLMIATADAGSRELALQQIDLKKVADRIQPVEAAARLLSFYGAQ